MKLITHKITHAFTLIELLIVVAIIAILAAIAVPNFLEAQTRSKVSRVKADMRSITTGIEAYHVQFNNYPPGYNTAPRFGLEALTTPIAFITSANVIDPFKPPGHKMSQQLLTYELVNRDGKIVEANTGPYSVNPASPGGEPAKGVAWWLASRGPDKEFGFRGSEPEFNIIQRFYESDANPEAFLDIVYDPTNGTVSQGNIFRSGGAPVNFAIKVMNE